MKKLLNLLCTISLIVTGASGIVANRSYKNFQENEKTHIHFTDAHWARQQKDGFNFLPTIMLEWQGFFGQILCRVIISVLYWC